MGKHGKGAPPTTSASPGPMIKEARKRSRNRLPKIMAKLITDNRDPVRNKGIKSLGRSKGKRFSAVEHVATKGHREKRKSRRRRLGDKERENIVPREEATFIKAE